MARLSILALCLISAIAINFVECSTLPMASGFKVRTVENIDDFLKENPEVQLQPLDVIEETVFDGVKPKIQTRYTFGNRISGDYFLADAHGSQDWSTPQNHRQTLRYPANGIGPYVTYLEVIVDQSSYLARSFISGGGIGQRFIEIVIEAQNTYYFNYRAAVYGYN